MKNSAPANQGCQDRANLRWLALLLLLLTLSVAADPKADIATAAQRFHEALAAARTPSELYPLITKQSIVDLEAEQKKNPAEFAKVWELGKMFSLMDQPPAGARKFEECKVEGKRATYLSGYTYEDKNATSKSTQKTVLELEDGSWKVVFKPQP